MSVVPDAVVGVDVGGTFTDIVLRRPGAAPVTAKVLTTPDDPARGILRGVRSVLDRAAIGPDAVAELVHGTTLATNTVLQNAGAPVLLVTTAGFADLFVLGRSARVEEERFDLRHGDHRGGVGPVAVAEVVERMDAFGDVVIPLDAAVAAAHVCAEADRYGAVSIAVCLLHSWADPDHETRLGEAIAQLRPDLHVSLSTAVWPELREHDRASTTFLAATLAPSMSAYLDGLVGALAAIGLTAPLWVMDSAGGLIPPGVAAARPVLTVESGGSAGVRAVADLAGELGLEQAVAFDMGGTTAKVGLVTDRRVTITHEFQLGGKGSFGVPRAGTGLPIKGPVVDLCEISAGGGSVAWVDDAGSLHVGPRSAGAVPGPAAYGRGGTATTVTDANVVLGVLAEGELNDGVSIDGRLAREAIERDIAAPLGIDVGAAAHAVRAIAVAKMAAAIGMMTVQRGIDPRDLPLVATGGAGPMHAAELAEQFGITTVVVPALAGVASAVGLTSAPPSSEHVRSLPLAATADHLEAVGKILDELVAAGSAALVGDDLVVAASIDMRLRGQAHSIRVDLDGRGPLELATVLDRFAASYQRTYGVPPVGPAEFLTYRVRVAAPARSFPPAARVIVPGRSAPGSRALRTGGDSVSDATVWSWETLPAGAGFDGPALVEGYDTTVHVPANWTTTVTDAGHLRLTYRPAARPTGVPR